MSRQVRERRGQLSAIARARSRPVTPRPGTGPSPGPARELPLLYLGAPEPTWLGRLHVPLMVSRHRMARLSHTLPTARVGWVLDSGGYTELARHGRWAISAEQYAEQAQRWAAEVGHLQWAAPQDWMCTPQMLARTGLSVREHQERTVANLVLLRRLAPGIHWLPMLQGWSPGQYDKHRQMYRSAGVRLESEPLIGIGSVAGRQGDPSIMAFIDELAQGLAVHGFGLKTRALAAGLALASIDSQAWSAQARRQQIRLPGCTHRVCSYCPGYAARWRARLIERGLAR